MQRDLKAVREEARAFAAQHVVELARNINEWHDTALLPDQCKMRELATLCEALDRAHSLQLAESFANRACRDAAALASAPAADLTDDQIDACVGNLGMAPYSVLAGPEEIRKFARKLLAEQALHPQAQVVATDARIWTKVAEEIALVLGDPDCKLSRGARRALGWVAAVAGRQHG